MVAKKLSGENRRREKEHAHKRDIKLQKSYNKVNSQSQRKRFLVVSEGEVTEVNYFQSLAKKYNNIEIQTYGTGANTLSLLKEALETEKIFKEKFDSKWLVFDKDSFPADNFDNTIEACDAHKFTPAWSNEAFELWFILHFEFRNTAMPRDDYEGTLSQHLGCRYTKDMPDIYSILCDKTAIAIDNAEKLEAINRHIPAHECNPGTTVHKLVTEIKQIHREVTKQNRRQKSS